MTCDSDQIVPTRLLVDECDRYLEGLHCVLWGRAFNAHHPKGREEAAEWLARQIEGVRRANA